MDTLNRNKEEGLLRQATEKFRATTGIEGKIVAEEHQYANNKRLDALVEFAITDNPTIYAVEVKRRLTKTVLGLVAEKLRDTGYKGMVVTDYVNPPMAERLKQLDIAFIDLVGNAYFNEPPVLVFIKGNRPIENQMLGRTLQPTRAFQATGLKVVFGLLINPKLVEAPYREIADVTDVALGTVGWVFTDLKRHGLLYEDERGVRKLRDRKQIIDKWITAYPEKLRPKLTMGRYRAHRPDWWREAHLDIETAQWGGEVAAAILTDYLKPAFAVIYAARTPVRLIAEHQLEKDPEGNVEVLQRFWNRNLETTAAFAVNAPRGVVPPLLVYADLMATADARNIETAKRIYDEFID